MKRLMVSAFKKQFDEFLIMGIPPPFSLEWITQTLFMLAACESLLLIPRFVLV